MSSRLIHFFSQCNICFIMYYMYLFLGYSVNCHLCTSVNWFWENKDLVFVTQKFVLCLIQETTSKTPFIYMFCECLWISIVLFSLQIKRNTDMLYLHWSYICQDNITTEYLHSMKPFACNFFSVHNVIIQWQHAWSTCTKYMQIYRTELLSILYKYIFSNTFISCKKYLCFNKILYDIESVRDCSLMPSEQNFSFILANFFRTRSCWFLVGSRSTHWVEYFIVLSNWKSSLQVRMSDTLS